MPTPQSNMAVMGRRKAISQYSFPYYCRKEPSSRQVSGQKENLLFVATFTNCPFLI